MWKFLAFIMGKSSSIECAIQSILVNPSQSNQTTETQQLRFSVGLKSFEVNYSSPFHAFDPKTIDILPQFDLFVNKRSPTFGYIITEIQLSFSNYSSQ